jgi:dTDP-4-amino-4,6-dideoxygalactose transaminase
MTTPVLAGPVASGTGAGSPIPITAVSLGPEVEQAVLEVIRSGSIAQGPMVQRLETEFAAMIGVDHVVAVNNGTTALIAALHVLDLQPGDEVITSPFTFVATLNAVLQAGATVRFADIDPVDYNVDPASVAALINDRTQVLLPVHLYGQCAEMVSLSDLATRLDLALVEDAAQAHGARLGGRSAGSWGLGCFSLYATKNLTSGEGGLISTNDAVLADRLRVLRNQGMRRRYEYEMVGNNYRMTDLQAAVCVPQLPGYDDVVAARQRNAAVLSAGLRDVPGVITPMVQVDRRHVWHQYTIRLADDAPVDRAALVAGLEARGIGCGVYYPRPVFDYDCYRGDPRVFVDDVPRARAVADRCLSLPVHQHLTMGELHRVIDAVAEVLTRQPVDR